MSTANPSPAAAPASTIAMGTVDDPLIQVRDLVKHFQLSGGWLTRKRTYVHAVDGVSFDVQRGEVLGIVGESGCGKTTLGRLLLRLIEPTAGSVLFDGRDLTELSGGELRSLRRRMQLVFQAPMASLSPRLKVLDIIGEPLRTHGVVSNKADMRARVVALLEQVGMGAQHLDRFPHEMSGGQCQRVAIARALALEPRFIVLDEPTSALDVSVQAQILNLLDELRRAKGLTYIFISHDLGVVQHVSDRIGVMYLGELVELGPSAQLFDDPLHPYTQALLGAIPTPDIATRPEEEHELVILEGNVTSPANPPSGCRFHTRCPLVHDRCRQEKPILHEVGAGRFVACHLVE